MVLRTITWAQCQRDGTSRAAGPSTVPRGVLSGAARTAGVPLIGAALTPTSPMTSADQMTSTPTSALATGYVNLRGEEDLYRKKRSGGVGAPGLRFLLITGSSVRGMAGARPGALQGRGKAADLETNASPGILRTHGFEGAEKKGGMDTSWVRFFFPGAFHLFSPQKFLSSLTWGESTLPPLGFVFRLTNIYMPLTFMWFFFVSTIQKSFFFLLISWSF